MRNWKKIGCIGLFDILWHNKRMDFSTSKYCLDRTNWARTRNAIRIPINNGGIFDLDFSVIRGKLT